MLDASKTFALSFALRFMDRLEFWRKKWRRHMPPRGLHHDHVLGLLRQVLVGQLSNGGLHTTYTPTVWVNPWPGLAELRGRHSIEQSVE